MIDFIESVDGLDTVALQRKCPELFNVTDKDGVPNWKLRPAVLETLHSAERSTTTTRVFLYPSGSASYRRNSDLEVDIFDGVCCDGIG
jgi:hypothetical protein